MFWPPPDILRANVQRATGGTLSTPSELFAKAKDALDRGQGLSSGPSSAPRPLRGDLFGSGPWPDTYEPRGAFHLFWEGNGLSEWDVEPGWRVLPEEHK